MGQKVHPIGFRLGIYLDWHARWYARDSYGTQLLEDLAIRKMLKKELKHAEIARTVIEKAGDSIRIILYSARPGVIIGKKGQEIDTLRQRMMKQLKKSNVEISVQEIKNPDLDAHLLSRSVADQLERRASFKKAMKRAAVAAMRAGAQGVKICCSGRLNGAEIARSEWTRVGSVPLHTIRSDIDYALTEAITTYGKIGVKVWICRGEFQQI